MKCKRLVLSRFVACLYWKLRNRPVFRQFLSAGARKPPAGKFPQAALGSPFTYRSAPEMQARFGALRNRTFPPQRPQRNAGRKPKAPNL